jgi:gliding motility-associated-like protein
MFVNKSTVDFGDVTHVDWYFDFVNEPSSKYRDENPMPGKVYAHKYPEFYDPLITKKYIVRFIAYSGTNCVNEVNQEVILKPVPVLEFLLPESVCREVTPFPLNGKESKGFAGDGKYSGNGVSAGGIFSPTSAGVGLHTITYIYTPTDGCPDTISRDILVYPSPTVDAGKDKVLLSGGMIALPLITTEEITSYQWSPATGLDHTDIANPNTSTDKSITYTVTVTTANGCKATDQVFVKVLDLPEVPNTFTPNNDGVNDLWNIKYLDSYPGCIVDIFSRFGNKVYTSVGYTKPWDGKSQGVDLPTGTYYYLIRPKNGRKDIAGSITIIR